MKSTLINFLERASEQLDALLMLITSGLLVAVGVLVTSTALSEGTPVLAVAGVGAVIAGGVITKMTSKLLPSKEDHLESKQAHLFRRLTYGMYEPHQSVGSSIYNDFQELRHLHFSNGNDSKGIYTAAKDLAIWGGEAVISLNHQFEEIERLSKRANSPEEKAYVLRLERNYEELLSKLKEANDSMVEYCENVSQLKMLLDVSNDHNPHVKLIAAYPGEDTQEMSYLNLATQEIENREQQSLAGGTKKIPLKIQGSPS